MTIGYLANSFDLLNVRDLDLIHQARLACTTLVVGVFSDEFAESLYGRRPVVPLVERMTLVSHVMGVDEVVVHDAVAPPVSGDVTFGVAGEVVPPGSEVTWLLQPTRETASTALRAALSPARQDDVA